jgi:hypothetical protein
MAVFEIMLMMLCGIEAKREGFQVLDFLLSNTHIW